MTGVVQYIWSCHISKAVCALVSMPSIGSKNFGGILAPHGVQNSVARPFLAFLN